MRAWVFFLIVGFQFVASARAPMEDANLAAPLPANIWIEMSRITQPGVVGIFLDVNMKTARLRRDPLFDFIEEFFGHGFEYEDPRSKEESTPIGTGFIIDKEGHIVTNYHVVEATEDRRLQTKLQVQINGEGKLLDVEVLGRDKRGDLALLKLKKPPKTISPLQFGDSNQLKVGEYVAAFGNPYGHSNSMTVGVVSAKGRAIKEINRFPFIQTDASINPGNSGGPLLNTQGYVIGVNTAIDARAQGIGFAIPSNYVKKIVNTLKAGGTIKRGYLGIGLATLHPRVALSYGIKKRGVVVAQVEPGQAAAKAGLQENDIIFEFDGKSISHAEDLVAHVQDTEVGRTVKVKVLRPTDNDFKEMTFPVTLGAYPGSARAQKPMAPKSFPKPLDPKYSGQPDPLKLGFSVVDSSSGARRALDVPIRFPFGPVVTQVTPDSPAYRGGFRPGHIILQVNGQGANSAKEVFELLRPGVNRFWIHTSRGEKKISLKPG